MSVEALAGKGVDGRSDVFAVGVVAWELITGRRLFTGKTELEVIERVRDGAVVPPSTFNPSCTPTLDGVVLQALARNRDERWSSAGALRNAIETTRRAYREESMPGDVVKWREQLLPPVARNADATVPVPRYEGEPGETDNEKTQFRPAAWQAPKRAPTMLDLLDEEPAEVAAGTDQVRPVNDTAATPLIEPHFDTFPADEGQRTVLAAEAYPANAFRDQPTVAYADQVPYAEIAVTRPSTAAPLSVHTAATVTAPILALTEPASGTSITAVNVAAPVPTVTSEMLQLDDPVAHDVLDLQDPLAELLDLDEPPAAKKEKAPELLDLGPADTVIIKRER